MTKLSRKIASRNIPSSLQITTDIAVWLLMDRLHAPGWAFGVFWTLVTIITIIVVAEWATSESVDLLNEKKTP
jgi:heme/copper-type cytochrome/quinol oxidase subunit 4